MIADAIEASGKTQREIATAMGYDRPNAISMMKKGEMRVPLERMTDREYSFIRPTGSATLNRKITGTADMISVHDRIRAALSPRLPVLLVADL